jgi:hypothetical protein
MPYCREVTVVSSDPPGATIREYAGHTPDLTRDPDLRGIGTWRLFLGQQLFRGRAKVRMTNFHTGGDTYEGNYEEGMEHGYGVYTNVLGTGMYAGMKKLGMWNMGIMHGEGRLEYTDVQARPCKSFPCACSLATPERCMPEYAGLYVNNVKHGKGTLTHPDGACPQPALLLLQPNWQQ